MAFFISYSRRDDGAVQVLATDLERTRNAIWIDRELGGGEDWWQEILRQIREASVFVFAVSTNSLRSRPCLAELEYAIALGVPVLPVQVGAVDSFRTTPVAEKQVIDYRGRTADHANLALAEPVIDLVVATTDLASRRGPLPDPLPAPPPIPYEYLMQIRLAVDAPEIPSRIQLQMLTQLKQALRDEEDAEARRDVIDLLHRLRRHPDTTYRNAIEVDELIASFDGAARVGDPPTPPEEPVPAEPEPATPPITRTRPTDLPRKAAEPTPPAAAKPKPAPPASSRHPAVALGLGSLGVGQVVLFMNIYLRTPLVVPAAVILVLTLAGAGMANVALRQDQPLARLSLLVCLLGLVIATAVTIRVR